MKEGLPQNTYQNLKAGERNGEAAQKSNTESFLLPITIASTHSSLPSSVPLLLLRRPTLLSLLATAQVQRDFSLADVEFHPNKSWERRLAREVMLSDSNGNWNSEASQVEHSPAALGYNRFMDNPMILWRTQQRQAAERRRTPAQKVEEIERVSDLEKTSDEDLTRFRKA